MRTKLIKKHNPQSFLDDLKRVREVMVYAECTNSYYQILKKDLLRDAERKTITLLITVLFLQIHLSYLPRYNSPLPFHRI